MKFDRYLRYMKPWDAPDFADGWENFEDEMMALEAIENWEPRSESIPISENSVQWRRGPGKLGLPAAG